MERNYKLYVHIAPNGKRYYGITRMNTKRRWENGKGYRNNDYFTKAINKYGWDNFTHEILFNNLTEDEAKLLEQCYIVLYDTTDRQKGYNITLGGESAKGLCGELNGMYGVHICGENHHMYGKHHSNKTKQMISEKLSGKNNPMYGKSGKNSPSRKDVICITTKRIFYSTKEGAKYYNTHDTHISACCKGKLKSAGKLPDGTKLVWRYLNYKHNKTYRVINIENNQEAS